MKTRYTAFLLACCLVSAGASAAGSDTNNARPDRAALEAALQSCASSLSSDSNGRPDPQAMDSCMSAKGFSRPSGPPPGRGPGRDNNSDSSSSDSQ